MYAAKGPKKPLSVKRWDSKYRFENFISVQVMVEIQTYLKPVLQMGLRRCQVTSDRQNNTATHAHIGRNTPRPALTDGLRLACVL